MDWFGLYINRCYINEYQNWRIKVALDHTFVICTYKESKYLEKCILSLINQEKKSEIFIATSTPNKFIEKISEKYNIPFYVHNSGGIGNDWNYGLSLVKTKYATIAHQDDVYCENFSITCIEQMKNKTIITFTNYREIKNEKIVSCGRNIKLKEKMLMPLKTFSNSRFMRNCILSVGSPICCPAVTYNMEMLDGFKFSSEMTVSLDWEAWHRLSQLYGRFCYIPTVLMYHRIHSESETTNAISDNKRTEEDWIMFRKFWPKWISKIFLKFYTKSQESNMGN